MKPALYYELLINEKRIGLLKSFEEIVEREVKTQRTYRDNAVRQFLPGVSSYTLRLKRLRTELSEPARLENLQDFSVSLNSEERSIRYEGCVFVSMTMRVDENGTMLEEAVLRAKTRTVTSD